VEYKPVHYRITVTGRPIDGEGYPHNRAAFDNIVDALEASGFSWTVDLYETWGDPERLYTSRNKVT